MSGSDPFAEHNPAVFLTLLLAGLATAPGLVLYAFGSGAMLLVRARKATATAAVTWAAAVRPVAALVWAGAAGMYTWGLLHLMFTDDYGRSMACHEVGAEHVVGYDPSFVPLGFGCRLDDGRTVDVIVPGYVNAWAFPLAACAVPLTLYVISRNRAEAGTREAGGDAHEGGVPGRHWFACLGMNLLLGVPAIVPVWLLWYFAANWPLAALGWTRGEPTENDGMLPWFLLAGPVVGVFALVWWLVNRAVARRTRLRGGPYWAAGAVTVLVPSLAGVAVTALL